MVGAEMSDRPSMMVREELVKKLRAGQDARWSVKVRVSGTLLALGLVLGAGSQSALLVGDSLDWNENLWCPAWDVAWLMLCMGLCISCYAPLSDDVWLARLVIVLNAVKIGYEMRWEFYWTQNRSLDLGVSQIEGRCPLDHLFQFNTISVYLLFDCIFILMSVVSFFCRGPSGVQGMMWATHRTYFSLQLLWELTLLVLGYYGVSCDHCWYSFMWVDAVALFLCSHKGPLDLVHRALRGVFARTRAKVAAASIAGLLGDCDAHQAFAQATARFRCIDLTMLTREEMATREPDPALYRRSAHVRLGECDAFISHSWSDDAAGKWAALQRWREAFIAQRGREPKVWIDKCCIDQANIEADLRCLPIFLSGCKEMVVLCGPTYFGRLWCVMELFTHYHMGLSQELTVRPVLREDACDDDLAAMHTAVGSFDVGHCECGSSGDRDKLMEIIRADGIQEFNTEMLAVLMRTGLMRDDKSERISDTASSVVPVARIRAGIRDCENVVTSCSSPSFSI